ncbi:WG repeat-containing protein [Bradyrhizobium lablabi]|uniref:WG repeat-containing protein n=1 Tax=Bradyrhizobium lablabi TaxID=722472 RepID=UPI001BA5DCBD|nr:WG repeat-containing protein [Bradyrhizobium lablabi]MBR1124025.1 WG repeat-containing protein [Bradyrhizobium lablabi]
MRVWPYIAALVAIIAARGVLAQDKPPELTPAGKVILQGKLAAEGQPLYDRPGPGKPITFPLAMCTFPGGLCGAVRRDGTVAVSPRYDWVGKFSDNRAAVRLNGLYGFVDEEGREVVRPQYRIVGDYEYGFAQVDVDGKSGLIDRDGKMVFAPKYGFITAMGPDRFYVSEHRWVGGTTGAEDFSGMRTEFTATGGMKVIGLFLGSDTIMPDSSGYVVDIAGRQIEPRAQFPAFDKNDPSITWVQREKLWGLARSDGSWLVEPKFQYVDALRDGLARVTLNGKVGFLDRTGNFAIEPVFDKAEWFTSGLGRTSAERDGVVGVIDKTGAWVFRTNYQYLYLARQLGKDGEPETVFGWHFKNDNRWGLLNLDGRVVLNAEFDQVVWRCGDDRLRAYRNKDLLYFKADGSPLQPPDGRLLNFACSDAPLYTLKIGDKYGLLDSNLRPLTPVHFDAMVWAGQNARNAKIDGKWGRIGPDGRWLLEPRFDHLSSDTDPFVASIDGKRGFVRADGSWLIEPKFDAAIIGRDGKAFVTIAGTTGVVRLADQSWIVQPRRGVMCDIGGGLISEVDGKRVVLSPAGETWVDIGAERIGINLDLGLLTFLRDGKWGLVDTSGQVMLEPQFEEPTYFTQRGIAWAKRDGRWCAINRRGHPVPGIACADADPLRRPNARFECKVEP